MPQTQTAPVPVPRRTAVALLLLCNLLLLLLAAAHHAFWRDEAQAWLLARDSANLPALLHNLRYEGHPPLWHLLLFPLAHASGNPEWMKLPNLLFAAITAGLLLWTRRLPLPVRAGLVFSYFLLFEYGTITRNYMLGVMLVVAATLVLLEQPGAGHRWTRGRTQRWGVPVLLALAALSSLPALILAGCVFLLWLAFGLGLLTTAGTDAVPLRERFARNWRALLPGCVLFGACALASVLLIRPPGDTGVFLEFVQYNRGLKSWIAVGSQIFLEALLPIPVPHHAFWNVPWYTVLPRHSSAFLGWVLFAAVLWMLRHRASRVLFAGGSLLYIAQMIAARRFFMRSEGWVFILLIVTLLLDAALQGRPRAAESARTRPLRLGVLGLILCAQVYGGLFAVFTSLRYPFTRSQQAARYLQAHHLDQAPLLFEPDFVSPSILAYLDHPAAPSLELHRPNSFTVWNRDEFLNRHIPTREELASYAVEGRAPVLITDKPLDPAEVTSLGLETLPSFTGGICTIDNYYLYRVIGQGR